MLAYAVIQFLDGNVLVPLLFSEAVIASNHDHCCYFGLWRTPGVFGVFFAIPLATFIKAIYVAWPRAPLDGEASDAT